MLKKTWINNDDDRAQLTLVTDVDSPASSFYRLLISKPSEKISAAADTEYITTVKEAQG